MSAADGPGLSEIDKLVHIEAIRKLKARYFRALDTKNWAVWLEVFTEDATLQFDLAEAPLMAAGGESPKLEGRAAIAAMVPVDLATARTVHHGHTAEIEILSDREARAVWAMDDVVDHGHMIIRGAGHYHETYRRTAEGWRIATVHLTRIRLEQHVQGRARL
jgi:hypothetical protein